MKAAALEDEIERCICHSMGGRGSFPVHRFPLAEHDTVVMTQSPAKKMTPPLKPVRSMRFKRRLVRPMRESCTPESTSQLIQISSTLEIIGRYCEQSYSHETLLSLTGARQICGNNELEVHPLSVSEIVTFSTEIYIIPIFPIRCHRCLVWVNNASSLRITEMLVSIKD